MTAAMPEDRGIGNRGEGIKKELPMDLSKRISGFQASPIRRLVPYATEAKKRGIHVYHLNIGQPDIKTPERVLDAIHSFNNPVIAYGESEGDAALRSELTRYYASYSLEVSEDEIMVTTGGSEALQFVLMTLCDPGDEVIIPEPYYTNVGSFAKSAGVVLKAVSSRFEDDFALPPLEDFKARISDRTKAILLCSPNNPTGYVYSPQELADILELARQEDLFLIVDEVYREFCYDGQSFVSALTFSEYHDRIVVVDSFSKRYSMCGARIGALVTKRRDILDGAMKLAQARLCPPEIEQVAALAALGTPDSYIQEVRQEYQARRDFLVKELNSIEGVSCSTPKGAFYVIAELPVENAEDFCLFLLKDFSYKGQTVMFAPAEGFYVTEGMGRNQVRIAYVLNTEDLKHAMECLRVALSEYRF